MKSWKYQSHDIPRIYMIGTDPNLYLAEDSQLDITSQNYLEVQQDKKSVPSS